MKKTFFSNPPQSQPVLQITTNLTHLIGLKVMSTHTLSNGNGLIVFNDGQTLEFGHAK